IYPPPLPDALPIYPQDRREPRARAARRAGGPDRGGHPGAEEEGADAGARGAGDRPRGLRRPAGRRRRRRRAGERGRGASAAVVRRGAPLPPVPPEEPAIAEEALDLIDVQYEVLAVSADPL